MWQTKTPFSSLRSGFTLVEISVVMGMFVFFTTFIIINVLRPQQKASLDTIATTLLSDLRSQQNKAMKGETEGVGSSSAYGVQFSQTAYVLFKGSTYSAADTGNFTTSLPQSVELSPINLENSQVVFSQLSGEVMNYNAQFHSIVIRNTTTGEQKVILINQLGVPSLE